ncbi:MULTISPECIES: hypothetical protein [Brevundimonas]|jgi:hypothetical protein|uniref:Uncharacterized protein n=1 Tax=Brevundimonas mediterranea TaxID=74329 RepID=A0A7Z8Y3M5_9CAUL|nr:hypothetical protein [Brevundimonas mediterranea]VDC50080.1 hypothetical protein BREV_BREV_00156 [Brevundimonas mediterranea]
MTRRAPVQTARVQVYLNDPKVISSLGREARAGKVSVSQAAGHALARGLQSSPRADPEDRLLALEQALKGHMRTTARDMQIIQELLVELARAFFLRLPDGVADHDPTVLAAVERRIEQMLDDTAARIVSGRTVPEDDRRRPDDRSFRPAD